MVGCARPVVLLRSGLGASWQAAVAVQSLFRMTRHCCRRRAIVWLRSGASNYTIMLAIMLSSSPCVLSGRHRLPPLQARRQAHLPGMCIEWPVWTGKRMQQWWTIGRPCQSSHDWKQVSALLS